MFEVISKIATLILGSIGLIVVLYCVFNFKKLKQGEAGPMIILAIIMYGALMLACWSKFF